MRESLFNIIQRDVPGATVLDLFAGTGALALEALSRGAVKAVLVDSSRQAIDCVRRNVQTLGFSRQADILQGDWQTMVERLSQTKQCFDLVFLDPPYRLSAYAEMTDMLQSKGLLAQHALIVIEHRKNVPVALSPAFIPRDCRTYGDTMIHMLTFDAGGNTDGK